MVNNSNLTKCDNSNPNTKVMNLTGKCKEGFNQYYIDKYYSNLEMPNYKTSQLIEFWKKKDVEKYGILVDYFDSVNIIIQIRYLSNYNFWQLKIERKGYKYTNTNIKTRNETRIKAIKESNELYNGKDDQKET